MSEDGDAYLHLSAFADISPDFISNTSKTFSAPACLRSAQYRHLTTYRFRAFGYDHYTCLVATFFAVNNLLAYFTYIKRDFRDEDHISASPDSRFQCYPSYIASHYLYDHDPMVAFSSGVKSIQCLCGCLHCGVKSKSNIRCQDLVCRLLLEKKKKKQK